MDYQNETKSDNEVKKNSPERLLDSAEKLFSVKGFDATSVRELAADAECNIASVNYHFGGKENLYQEVWRRQLKIIRETRLRSIETVMKKNNGRPELEELLRSYAHAFIEPFGDENKSRQLMRLMAREIIDPHLPRDMFITEMVSPVMAALQEAFLKLCPALKPDIIPIIIISIVGQLMQNLHYRALLEQSEQHNVKQYDLNEIIDYTVRFSAAGIREFAQVKK